jgi:hypothetical protein
MEHDTFASGIPVKNGWSVARNMVTGDKALIASLQADFKQKPGIYTAQFTISTIDKTAPPIPPGKFFAPIQAIAEIDWAVEGNTITRKISVANGASISGPGQAVRITIKDVSYISDSDFVLGQKYFVAATLTPGLRATAFPPILTIENKATTILPGGTASFPVPDNAGVTSVLVTVISSVGLAIPEQGVQVTQDGNFFTATAQYDPRAYEFVPLIPGTAKISVNNLTAANDMAVFVVWGIDG